MDWTRPLDLYCERLGPGIWAEPANALTNAAFLIAAWAGWRAAHRRDRLDWPLAVLIAITALVGIGSFLFHTVATVWAMIADVVPIQLFIVGYFALAMRRFAGLGRGLSAVATGLFVGASAWGGAALADMVGARLNGSESYLPPLAALVAVGLVLLALEGRAAAGRSLLVAAAIFAVSLAFRTADAAVCYTFPLGTHFLWHALNGLLLGYLLVAMARLGAPASAPSRPGRRPRSR